MSDLLVPPHVRAYVDVLGVDGAVDFLLRFGGSQVYLSRSPGADAMVVGAIGHGAAIALAERFDVPPNVIDVPAAKPFIAKVLKRRGLDIAEICRQLHCTRPAVRNMLSNDRQLREFNRRPADDRQLSMFDED